MSNRRSRHFFFPRQKILMSDAVRAVELPYQQDRFAMSIVMLDGERALLDRGVNEVLAEMRTQRVKLIVPKVELEPPAVQLREALSRMGITAVFDASSSPFAALTTRPLGLDDVLHKTFLRIDELGTEVAAATAAIAAQSMAPKVPEFRIDRPFIFLIRDLADQSILFWGRITDPTA